MRSEYFSATTPIHKSVLGKLKKLLQEVSMDINNPQVVLW